MSARGSLEVFSQVAVGWLEVWWRLAGGFLGGLLEVCWRLAEGCWATLCGSPQTNAFTFSIDTNKIEQRGPPPHHRDSSASAPQPLHTTPSGQVRGCQVSWPPGAHSNSDRLRLRATMGEGVVCVGEAVPAPLSDCGISRREVVRSSAGVGVVYPPFWGRSCSIPQGMVSEV